MVYEIEIITIIIIDVNIQFDIDIIINKQTQRFIIFYAKIKILGPHQKYYMQTISYLNE
jgi:hypothetical protein